MFKVEEAEAFEAISHPLRLRILRLLAKEPLSFSQLKQRLKMDSSGHLDFHLKKLQGLIEEEDGRYALTRNGYAALQAAQTLSKLGWQRRAYVINWLAAIFFTAYAAAVKPSALLWLIPIVAAWLTYHSYLTFVKRKVKLSGT
ncbi:MAG: hypothetical protein DRJ69_05940 [Thermoprotei archaeon]|nr:MAG: hypothetical protein DRJ69_05940 [Thermoprotei archaeon]